MKSVAKHGAYSHRYALFILSWALSGVVTPLSWAQAQGGIAAPGGEMPMPQATPAPPVVMPPMVMPGKKKPVPLTGAAPNPSVAPQPPPKNARESIMKLPILSDHKGWPSPTADDGKLSYLLFDRLEYQRASGPDALRWDVLGWQGGDYRRTWFKTEGSQNFSSRKGGEGEAQLLYGNLISPYFDFQAGVRYAQRWGRGPDPSRFYAVIGLQGLAPYRFDIEPMLFLSSSGKVSGRFTGTYDMLLSQNLILQPRLETSFALQKDEAFGVGSGLNDAEVSFLLRYEIRREFAPYVGVTWLHSFGGTADLLRRGGGDPSECRAVTGVRMWF